MSTVALLHPTVAHLAPASHTVIINQRPYIAKSEMERDEFDRYWNGTNNADLMDDTTGPGGCAAAAGMLAIALFFVVLIVSFLISAL